MRSNTGKASCVFLNRRSPDRARPGSLAQDGVAVVEMSHTVPRLAADGGEFIPVCSPRFGVFAASPPGGAR